MEDGLGGAEVRAEESRRGVLILVLMEDGLGATEKLMFRSVSLMVLILVLMEDGLGVVPEMWDENAPEKVLILVLMEDGLGVSHH